VQTPDAQQVIPALAMVLCPWGFMAPVYPQLIEEVSYPLQYRSGWSACRSDVKCQLPQRHS
jgi:hypothetical protein